jgi:protein arginine kinase activator
MLCQVCGKNVANVHFKQVVNGEKTELLLCEDCAENLGVPEVMESTFSQSFPSFDAMFEDFFPVFSSSPYGLQENTSEKCKVCGTTFEDISSSGRVGCANCYTTFAEELIPYVKRIHGNAKHVGKIAACCMKASVCNASSCEGKIKELKRKLNEAVQKQEFEQAAVLRDEINDLTKGGGCCNE